MTPKYPEIEVQLTGHDGNVFFVLGKVVGALRRHGVSRKEIDEFMREARAGDYDDALATCMKWVDVY